MAKPNTDGTASELVPKSYQVNIDELFSLQTDLLTRLRSLFKNFKKDSSDRKTKPYFQLRLRKVDELFAEFQQNHQQLIVQQCPNSHPYVQGEIAYHFDEEHSTLTCAILEAFEAKYPTTPASNSSGNSSTVQQHNMSITADSTVQLPKLPVPKYSGKFVDWPAFYDAFVQLIHDNTALSNVQKFHFLKQALPMDCDEDVAQMALTGDNYATAWKLIVQRYNNPRLQFMHHMNALHDLPQLTQERSSDLKHMVNIANVCINILQRLEIAIKPCDHWIAHLLVAKLPKNTLEAWEHYLGSSVQIPTFTQLESFINKRLISIDVIESRGHSTYPRASTPKSVSRNQNNISYKGSSFHATTGAVNLIRCAHCGSQHILRHCPEFLAKDCFARKGIVDRAKACLNCLSLSHPLSQCRSNKNCLQCGHRHHTLLHFPNVPATGTIPSQNRTTSHLNCPSDSIQSAVIDSSVGAHTARLSAALVTPRPPRTMLLATALVKLHNCETGQSAVIRALVDPGSEGTLITEHIVQALNLKRHSIAAEISGVGESSTNRCRYTTHLSLSACNNSTFNTEINPVFVLNSLTTHLPKQSVSLHNCRHLEGLDFADPTFFESNRIDLLLGVDIIPQIMLPELRKGNDDQPIAQRTKLGWIVFGQVNSANTHCTTIRCHHTNLEKLVQKFFDIDELNSTRSLTPEEEWCETHFQKTHTRQENGKYMVRLPFKRLFDPSQVLGKSRQIALNRFQMLERKFQRQPDLYHRYAKVINEYFELGQVSKITTTEEQQSTSSKTYGTICSSCTLPHHAVIKEESVTTKLRIVYDASCKTSNGRSLNDVLCTGPALQNDLAGVLINWRLHRFVFAADIQRMYRCIDMHPEDAQFQRIFWRDEHDQLAEYCLNTVTFGTASAPYTAIRVILQLAQDESSTYPLAENVLRNEIYVDDVQSGHSTTVGARDIRDQLIACLLSAGMELRKWSANHQSLLEDIPSEHLSNSSILEFDNQDSVKTLGLYWHPNRDYFGFKIKFQINPIFTKRSLLSTVARLYDPLGFITPVITTAKAILKEVWKARMQRDGGNHSPLEWDEQLPYPLQDHWREFVTNLPHIEHIKVQRWFGFDINDISNLQLHVFCDGSSIAYATSAYLRTECPNGTVLTHLVAARSRVTPTKPLTIPRVELSGALLAVKLAKWICTQLRTGKQKLPVIYWSDASIVLYWINGDTARWKTFVANRVGQILQSSSPAQWRHVPTSDNPADCATRGLTPQEIADHPLWWTGPAWLQQPELHWPTSTIATVDLSSCEEKTSTLVLHSQQELEGQQPFLKPYSSYNKSLSVVAYALRFITNIRKRKGDRQTGPLTVAELQAALGHIIRIIQLEEYTYEINLLKTKKSLPTTNKLCQLSPFLDENQILRVRGRLRNARHLSMEQRNPMIVPQNHPFTESLVQNAHRIALHGGTELTLATIRHQFWIVNGKQVVKRILRKCILCFRHRPKPSTQMMADLPLHRVNPPSRAFIATGVDYTGAFEIRASRFRGNTTYKAYIAVFICLATKAIHLEAVTGLSTEHFLMALNRFISRRGYCQHMYSDCGTNFIGADTALQSWNYNFLQELSKEVVPLLARRQIQWHFNPPHSPNFGGLWEANVKAVKTHLHRAFSGQKMTYEQLATVLTQIEACLNSRPLCPLNAEPDDLSVLTPAHFLIGDSLLAPPNVTTKDAPLTTQFLQGQKMLRQFWMRWSNDWLSHLQARPKWKREQDNLQVNDIVIVKDDRLPPSEWRLGKIIEVHPGADNLVRVATIKTASGVYKRSVSKICPLPLPRCDQTAS